jgi:hypothetical protein
MESYADLDQRRYPFLLNEDCFLLRVCFDKDLLGKAEVVCWLTEGEHTIRQELRLRRMRLFLDRRVAEARKTDQLCQLAMVLQARYELCFEREGGYRFLM